MRAVDTNIIVRLLARDDLAQLKVAEKCIATGVWVSHLVLAEALWVLSSLYERDAQQIADAVEMLLNHAQLTLHDADVVASALATFRARPMLGFSDCLVLEIARRAGHVPLATFDKNLGTQPGAQRI